MYHYTDGGLRNVWLKNGYVERSTPYGKGVSFHDLEGLTKAICMALVKRPGKLTGAEFRYVRSNLQLSQKSLGQMMGYTEQAVAKWEKSGKIPKVVEYFLRNLYMERNNGSEKVCSMIDTINLIERIANTRIIVRESKNKWTSKIETLNDDEGYALAA